MKQEDFKTIIESNAQLIEQIKNSAHELHASVNQTYDNNRLRDSIFCNICDRAYVLQKYHVKYHFNVRSYAWYRNAGG